MEYELDLQEVEKTKKLTPRQEKFCQEYVGCLLGYKAYQAAYPDAKYDTARANAAKLLADTSIKARVQELQKEQAERYQISAGFLIEKSLEVYSKASVGKDEVVVDKFGEIVKTGNKIYDTRGMNDALKNIASITGLNSQTIKAQVDAKAEANVKVVTADDVASKILGDDIDA
jgi:phage terminase small subunit